MSLTSKEKEALKVALVDHSLYSKSVKVLDENPELYVDVEISVAQVLALNATPVTVIAAPTTLNKAIVPIMAVTYKGAGTAYANIAAGDDLTLKYTNSSGAVLMTVECTGFLDQATAQTRVTASALTTAVAPVPNTPVVLHMLNTEVDTGDSPLKLRIYYKEIDTVL